MHFASRLAREFFQQFAVDVIADTNRRNRNLLRERIPLEPRKIFLRARRGNAVRKQNDVLVSGLLIHDRLERGLHRLINFRAAVGRNLADQIALVLKISGRPHGDHPVKSFVKRNDANLIDGTKCLDAGARRFAGHLDFRAAHASGLVQHEHNRGGFFRRRRGADRQHLLERRLRFLRELGIAVTGDKNQAAARVDIFFQSRIFIGGKFVIRIIIEQNGVPVPHSMIHGESRRRFDVHLRPLQRRQQRRGRLVAACNVEHTRPPHRHGLREQHLLGPGARDVHLHQIHAALGDLRLNIHSIVATVQIRLRRSDFMTLRSNPDARRNRARAVNLQGQHELFA